VKGRTVRPGGFEAKCEVFVIDDLQTFEVVPQLMAEEMDQAFVEQLEREGFRVLSRVALGAGDLA